MGGKKKAQQRGASSASTTTQPTSTSNSFAALLNAAEQMEEVSSSRSAASEGGKLKEPLVWIDLEMTGLDLDRHTIIEVAVIVTDGQLATKIEGPSIAIHQPEDVLERMNDWCVEHHGRSGLTKRVQESDVSMEQAEASVLEFVRAHVADPGSAQLAGNSVHVDRQFLLKYMPQLTAFLSYRIVDVSTIKELAKRWYPAANRRAPRKANAHTALSDIRESITELEYFRRTIFANAGGKAP
ncbi:hypothetical protein FOA52_000244 [Chlamydomonas sp. UWO 241]|nr:hypothetical protein FOA52_000244 [Chlamydomonas sp. UWO 241]